MQQPPFDYLASPQQGAPPPPGDPTAADPAAQGYSPEQFQNWYQQQFGAPVDAHMMTQIGQAVGDAAGPNGLYSQDQWNQAQQLAQQGGVQPFFPEFEAPTYEAGPAYEPPPTFQAPTMEQAQADPGYQFALQQGMKSLQGSQAARGLARTGGALKGLMDYGQQAASQQYDKVYGRAAQEYAQNYQIGRDAWRDNEAMRQSGFDRNYRSASDAFNARFRGRELTFEDLYRRWALKSNIQAQMALAD